MHARPNRKSHELDVGTAPEVETWLPGETLFSLVSRQHALLVHAKPADTCLHWFGHSRIGSAHDLPARIATFTERTKGRFGSTSSVIYKHTLLPYYLPFRPAQDSANAVAAMSSESIGALKAQLGILATRFGAAHPLKACKCCIEQDETNHHVAYWHVEHQLPGVWICPWHSEMLLVATVKWMGVERFGWHLPTNSNLSLAAVVDPNLHPDEETLQRLANASINLWSLPAKFHFSSERLFLLYRHEMMRTELCSQSGRVNTSAFSDAISKITMALSGIREFSSLPHSPEKISLAFGRLISNPRSVPHPLRQLIVILGLFGSWDSFFKQYREIQSSSARKIVNPNGEPLVAHLDSTATDTGIRSQFIEMLKTPNRSIRAAAESVGITVSTGMAWAAAANITVRRRGKILKPERRLQLIRTLRRGVSKAAAASAFGVSIQTVTTTLRTEVGLHERWIQARFKYAQKEARRAWKRTASGLPSVTAKALRTLQPAAFAWLYRHDRAWLESFSASLHRVPRTNHATLNWDKRDSKLSQAIHNAALAWHEQHRMGYLTNARLCQLIPELKSRLSSLDQMPLTRTALAQISRKTTKNEELRPSPLGNGC